MTSNYGHMNSILNEVEKLKYSLLTVTHNTGHYVYIYMHLLGSSVAQW